MTLAAAAAAAGASVPRNTPLWPCLVVLPKSQSKKKKVTWVAQSITCCNKGQLAKG